MKSILTKISTQHQINFTYLEDEIVVFKLEEPDISWDLDKKLDYIKEKTKLKIKTINKTYYSLYNDQNQDKPLCAFIIDADSEQPVSDVNISIEQTTIGTTSKTNGYFELPTISSNTIVITHLNYEPLFVSPKQLYISNCPILKFTPKTTQLAEIVTNRYLTVGISKKNDGSVLVTPKTIGHLPGLTEPDVFKTIQQIPGIISVDETLSNLNIRGGTHDQNLVLWNGIHLFQTGHFFGMISALNPNLAHQVKIIKNGSSAHYGDSVSSILDISTHTDSIQSQSNAIGVNLINLDFYNKSKISKSSNLEISGRRAYTDIVNTPTYTTYSNRIFQNTEVKNTTDNKNISIHSKERFYFYDFTLQWHQKIGTHTDIYLDGITIGNQLDLQQSKIEKGNTIDRKSNLQQNTLGGNFQLKTNWNPKNNLLFNTSASSYKIDSENQSIEGNQIFNQENTVLDLGISIQNNNQWTKNLKWLTGYQYNEIGIRNFDKINSPVFSRRIKEVLRNQALFSEFQWLSTNKKMRTSIGIRANYFEKFKELRVEPRLQFHYKLSKTIATELLAEAKNQSTTQIIDLQQDFLGIEKRRWILANGTTLPLTKSQQIAIGFHFKKNNWLITSEHFYKKVDGITAQSQGFQNQLEFNTAIGSYILWGSEWLLQKQISKFTSWFSYTYNDNQYNFNTLTPSQFPNNFEIKHAMAVACIFEDHYLKIALGGKWHSGKPITTPLTNQADNPLKKINFNTPNSEHLSAYFALNFSGSYTFKWHTKNSLQLGVALENILNQRNIVNQYYRINQNTNSIEQVNTYGLERSLNGFARWCF
ncbi:TonB-dependent receptor [Flavobacterium sp.]|uniref:TonB-dependent receptor n=1 Tax=Flavobacterium sp. TaxID=239 RepID=UPI003D096190